MVIVASNIRSELLLNIDMFDAHYKLLNEHFVGIDTDTEATLLRL